MGKNRCSKVNEIRPGTCYDIGNVTLIDPNGSVRNDSVKQEDLVLYANLTARLKSKSLIESTGDNNINIAHFTKGSDNSITEPVGKNFLTTDWTKISSFESQVGEDIETFGITSIDISVNASFTPTISISFTDIRGASLFEQGACSPYAAFYHQPWPIFELTIKGYYGYPVKYFLHLSKFDTQFNPATGNYDSKADFIGFSMAFLSDIPMGYALAAGYLPGAKDKLTEIYNRYKALYNDEDFDPTNGGDDPIILADFIKRVKLLKTPTNGGINPGVLDTISGSQELRTLTDSEDLTVIIDEIDEVIKTISEDWVNNGGGENVTQDSNILIWNNLSEGGDGGSIKNQLKDFYLANEIELKNLIEEFNELTKQNWPLETASKIIIPKDIIKLEEVGGNLKVDFNNYKNRKRGSLEVIKTETKKLTKRFNQKANQLIADEIGLLPNMRNVFIVLLANVELFLELLKDASYKAEEYHETTTDDEIFYPGKRTGLNSNNGEVPVKDIVYAWPKYVEPLIDDEGNNGVIETYPGENPRFTDWPEVTFVEDLLDALIKLEEEIQKEEEGEQNTDGEEFNGLPGYDNYMPINAMESPAAVIDSNNSYLSSNSVDEIEKDIFERFLVFSNFTCVNSNFLNTSTILAAKNYHVEENVIRAQKVNETTQVSTDTPAASSKVFPHLEYNLFTSVGESSKWRYISAGAPFNHPRMLLNGEDNNSFDSSKSRTFNPNNKMNQNRFTNGATDLVIGYPAINRFTTYDGLTPELGKKKILGITSSVSGFDPDEGKNYSPEGESSNFANLKLDANVSSVFYAYGQNEAYNFLTTVQSTKLYNLLRVKFDNLDDIYGEILQKMGYSFNDENGYYEDYLSTYTYKNDIELNKKSTEGPTVFKPDIHDMEAKDLVVLRPCGGCIRSVPQDETYTGGLRAIRLTPGDINTDSLEIKTDEEGNPLPVEYNNVNTIFGSLSKTNQNLFGYVQLSPDKLKDGATITLEGQPVTTGYKDVIKSRDINLVNDKFMQTRKVNYGVMVASGFKIKPTAPWITVGDGFGDNTLSVGYEGDFIPNRRNCFSQVNQVLKKMSTVEMVNDDFFAFNISPWNNRWNGSQIQGYPIQWKHATDGIAEINSIGYASEPDLNDLSSNFSNSKDDNILSIVTEMTNTSVKLGWHNIIPSFYIWDDDDHSVYRYSKTLGVIKTKRDKKTLFRHKFRLGYGDTGGMKYNIRSYNVPSSDFNLPLNSDGSVPDNWYGPFFKGSLSTRDDKDRWLKGIFGANTLSAGNIVTQTPFWQHNFPSKESESQSTNSFVYLPAGSKIYMKSNTSRSDTNLTASKQPTSDAIDLKPNFFAGIKTDLDWSEPNSEASHYFHLQQPVFNSANVAAPTPKGILTTHNFNEFDQKSTSDIKFDEENSNIVTSYNRTKAWKGSLAYLFLANQLHRPWTGMYSNRETYAGPQSILGTASLTAKVPKHSVLLLGAVLWRMREAGLLESDDEKWNMEPQVSFITDANGERKNVDPVNVPRVPKTLRFSDAIENEKYADYDTEHSCYQVSGGNRVGGNSPFKSTREFDTNNGSYDFNHGVRPPMYSLLMGNDPNADSRVRAVLFPRADEWPAPNHGMCDAIPITQITVGNKGNPFKNQYQIFTPFFKNNASNTLRIDNSIPRFAATEETIEYQSEQLKKAQAYIKENNQSISAYGDKILLQELDKAEGIWNQYSNSNASSLEDFLYQSPGAKFISPEQSALLLSAEEAAGVEGATYVGGGTYASEDESYTRLSFVSHKILEPTYTYGEPNPQLNRTNLRKPFSVPSKQEKAGAAGGGLEVSISGDLKSIKDLKLDDVGYLLGYIPIGPDIWFLPTKVKQLFIDEFESFVGNFNEFEDSSDFDFILKTLDPLNFPKPQPENRCPDTLDDQYPVQYGKDDLVPGTFISFAPVYNLTNGVYGLPFVATPGHKASWPTGFGSKCKDYSNDLHPAVEKFFQTYGSLKGQRSIPLTSEGNSSGQKGYLANNFRFIIEEVTKETPIFDQSTKDDILKVNEMLFNDGYYLTSATPRTWWGELPLKQERRTVAGNENVLVTELGKHENFFFNELEFKEFLRGFKNIIRGANPNLEPNVLKEEKENRERGDDISEDKDLRLTTYRSLKSLYDKWISSSDSGSLFYNVLRGCPNAEERPLIDYFSFVDRANRDISTKALVDIDSLSNLFNARSRSIQNYINDVMDNSNFLFLPLPTYVDLSLGISDFTKKQDDTKLSKEEILANMFVPQPTSQVFREYCFGPHYLCMYTGGNSQALDLTRARDNCIFSKDTKKLEHQGDGVSLIHGPQPEDLVTQNDGDNQPGVVAFRVNFGQENQSHFININVDQSEHKNTYESFKAMERLGQLVNNGGSSNGLPEKGQSLYDVYLNRSYSCSVEGLGNMMIQPFQYFELDSVPMFYGSYLITKVGHKITPNHMKTTFEGTRIPQATVPVVEDLVSAFNLAPSDTVTGSILDGASGGGSGGGSRGGGSGGAYVGSGERSGKCSGGENPLSIWLGEQGAKNGYIDSLGEVVNLGEISESVASSSKAFVEVGIEPMRRMVADLNAYEEEQGLPKRTKPGSIFRTAQYQSELVCNDDGCSKNGTVFCKCSNCPDFEGGSKCNRKGVATPGRSKHGWAIAVDFSIRDDDGTRISYDVTAGTAESNRGFNTTAYKWLFNNCYKYGFIHPLWARDGKKVDEFWHFEYVGKAAYSYMQAYPTNNAAGISGRDTYDVDLSGEVTYDFVTNPVSKKTNEEYSYFCYKDIEQIEIQNFVSDGTDNSAGYGTNSETDLWIYLAWQQGAGGASQHYSLAKQNGKVKKYSIPLKNITGNWPGGLTSAKGVSVNDAADLYNDVNKHPQLAEAFVDVWSQQYQKKTEQALTRINSSESNRSGVKYSEIKAAFQKYEKPEEALPWQSLANFGMIENGLQTDTKKSATFQTMFQMNKNYDIYKEVLDNLNQETSSYNSDYINWTPVDNFIALSVPKISSNFKTFINKSGFVVSPAPVIASNATTTGSNTKKIIDKDGNEQSSLGTGDKTKWLVNIPAKKTSRKIIYFFAGLETSVSRETQWSQIPTNIKSEYYIVMGAGISADSQPSLSEFKSVSNKIKSGTFNEEVILGYSAGGKNAFKNYDKKYKVVGFIDPSLASESQTEKRTYSSNAAMIWGSSGMMAISNWGDRYPKVQTAITNGGGKSKKITNLSHGIAIQKWFENYGNLLLGGSSNTTSKLVPPEVSNCNSSVPLGLNGDDDFTGAKTIIVGSSSVGTLNGISSNSGTYGGFNSNDVYVYYNCGGKDLTWLYKQVKDDSNVYNSVKNVFQVGIGTNDLYPVSQSAKNEINNYTYEMKKRFPNATLYVMPGTYGWDNVSGSEFTKNRLKQYYNQYTQAGWYVLWPKVNNVELDPNFATSGEAHTSSDPWFQQQMNYIQQKDQIT